MCSLAAKGKNNRVREKWMKWCVAEGRSLWTHYFRDSMDCSGLLLTAGKYFVFLLGRDWLMFPNKCAPVWVFYIGNLHVADEHCENLSFTFNSLIIKLIHYYPLFLPLFVYRLYKRNVLVSFLVPELFMELVNTGRGNTGQNTSFIIICNFDKSHS